MTSINEWSGLQPKRNPSVEPWQSIGAVSWQDVTYIDNQSDIFNLIFHVISVQKNTISATGDYDQVCFCQAKQLRVRLLNLGDALLQIGTVSPPDTANLRKKT